MTCRQPIDQRRRELALIHIGSKSLGMDRGTYERMLFVITRKRSASHLDQHQRQQVIDHLRACGAKLIRRESRPRASEDRAPLIGKIRAMLMEAHRSDAYGDGMSRRMFRVDRFEWCDPTQLHKIVAAPMYDQRRRTRV